MKHLFVVHSNITYLAALGVICKENLLSEDVIIISDVYKQTTPVKCYFVDFSATLKNIVTHPFKRLRPVRYVDNIITQLCKDDIYIAYVSALFNFQRIVVTHPLCRDFHFIEEGLSVYYKEIPAYLSIAQTNEFRPWRNVGLKALFSDIFMLLKGYNAKMQALPFLYNAYFNTINKKFYGFNKDSFYGVKHPELIDIKQLSDAFAFTKTYNIDNTHIWLGTSVVKAYRYPLKYYISAIENGCIRNIKKRDIDHIHIKFHPSECEISRNATLDIFHRNGITTAIIPDEIILEMELLTAVNVCLWAVDTSILIYTKKTNVECNSIVNFLKDYSKENIPTYWNSVNIIPNDEFCN